MLCHCHCRASRLTKSTSYNVLYHHDHARKVSMIAHIVMPCGMRCCTYASYACMYVRARKPRSLIGRCKARRSKTPAETENCIVSQ
ncbi:hypothetical protein BDV09DRAFT_46508 [Aspergillus tetrazonus]